MNTSVLERPIGDRRDTARTNTTTTTLTGTPIGGGGTGIEVIRPARLERERYEELLALPTAQLREHAAEEIRAELVLDTDRQREAIHTRLAAWLELDAEDARIVARTWDEAAAQLPADEARRRFEAECDAILHGFRFEDFTRFAEFMPWVRSHFGLALFSSASRGESAA